MSEDELLPDVPVRIAVDLLRRKLHRSHHLMHLIRYTTYFLLFVGHTLSEQAPTTSFGTLQVVQEAASASGTDWEELSMLAAANEWTQATLPSILSQLVDICPACKVSLELANQLEIAHGDAVHAKASVRGVCGPPPHDSSCADEKATKAALRGLRRFEAEGGAAASDAPAGASVAAARVLVEREEHVLVIEFHAAAKVRGSKLVACSTRVFARRVSKTVVECSLLALLCAMAARMLLDELREAAAAWSAMAFGAYLGDGWNWLDGLLLLLPPLCVLSEEEASHQLSALAVFVFGTRFFRSASCLAPFRLFLATLQAAVSHLLNFAVCAATAVALLALAGHVSFGAISAAFATPRAAVHTTVCIVLDGLYETPEDLEQHAPLASYVYKYAAVLLLVMLLLNMLIVVLMEAFDAVREAQKEDRLVDNTASGELLTALPGWQPLRRGVYSPWARLELWLRSPLRLVRDLLLDPSMGGVPARQLWEAMVGELAQREADDLPISEGKTDDIPTAVPSLQSTPSYEWHAPKQPRPPTAPQDETDEPDECLLDLDGLARALERVQPGLGGKAEEVMNLFGMVPERETPLSVRRFRSAPTRLRMASVLFVSSRKKLPAVSERLSM